MKKQVIDGQHQIADHYQPVTRTSSGWAISTSMKAGPDKRFRINHPEWGTYYFPTHEAAREKAFSIARTKAFEWLGKQR